MTLSRPIASIVRIKFALRQKKISQRPLSTSSQGNLIVIKTYIQPSLNELWGGQDLAREAINSHGINPEVY